MEHERHVSKEQAKQEFSDFLDRHIANKNTMPMAKWFAARELISREIALEYGMTYDEYEEYVEELAEGSK